MAFTAQLAPLALAAAEEEEGTGNFLVPNAHVLRRAGGVPAAVLPAWPSYVIPPINRAMERRQEAIRSEFAELDEAKAEAKGAEEEFKAQIADARKEAARIREEAREQGSADRRRGTSRPRSSRPTGSRSTAQAQIAAERQAALTSLRSEVGSLATTLAGRIVGESLEDDERSTRVVDRFLADLEAMESAKPSTNGASS